MKKLIQQILRKAYINNSLNYGSFIMKYFLDSSFILALIIKTDENYEKALELIDLFNEDCYINQNVLNEVLTLVGRKIDISAAKEVYYTLIDNFILLNEYSIGEYNGNNFAIFEKYAGINSKKTKVSFTDSSIILTMKEFGIKNLVSFDKEFKRVEGITLISKN